MRQNNFSYFQGAQLLVNSNLFNFRQANVDNFILDHQMCNIVGPNHSKSLPRSISVLKQGDSVDSPSTPDHLLFNQQRSNDTTTMDLERMRAISRFKSHHPCTNQPGCEIKRRLATQTQLTPRDQNFMGSTVVSCPPTAKEVTNEVSRIHDQHELFYVS